MPFVTKTVILGSDTNAYTAGDAVGGLLTFSDVTRAPGGGGEVRTVVLQEDTTQAASGTLYLYRKAFTPTANNSAFGPSDTDNQAGVGFVAVTAYPATAPANNQTATAAGVGLAYQCEPGSTTLYGQFQTNGTPTYAANGVRLKVTFYYE